MAWITVITDERGDDRYNPDVCKVTPDFPWRAVDPITTAVPNCRRVADRCEPTNLTKSPNNKLFYHQSAAFAAT